MPIEGVADATAEFPDKVIGKDGKKYAAKDKRKSNTCIIAKSMGEAKRAFDACEGIDCSDLPNSNMDVKRIERVAREIQNEQLRTQDYSDFKADQAELLLGDFRIKGKKEIADESVGLILQIRPIPRKRSRCGMT